MIGTSCRNYFLEVVHIVSHWRTFVNLSKYKKWYSHAVIFCAIHTNTFFVNKKHQELPLFSWCFLIIS